MSLSKTNKKSRTILQIIPNLEAGGAERATVDIAEAIVKSGQRAIVVSTGGPMATEVKAKRAKHIEHDVATKNPLMIVFNAGWLIALILREKIDIVHVRSRAPAWSAYFATRITRTPFVTTFHAAYKGEGGLKKIYNSIMTKSDRIIAISGFIARHIQKNYGITRKKITVIPRGIDMASYHPDVISADRKNALRVIWNNNAHAPVMIMPGRLSPIKGHELVLDALREIKNQNFLCVFIGPDQGRIEYRQKLVNLAKEYGLQDKIIWMNGGDIPAAYALAQIVLSPSQVAEGFGRVPVEAQAMGLPVIATALGATDETVLDGETGWLVPVGDAQALSAAMAKALNLSPTERVMMAQKAMSHVRSKFDLHEMCAATLAVYEEVAQ